MQTLQTLTFIFFIALWFSIIIGVPAYAIYYIIAKRKLVLEENVKALVWPRGFMAFLGTIALTYNIAAHDLVFDPHYHPGIGVGIMMLVVVGGLWLMMPKEKRSWATHSTALVSVLAFFAIAFRANGFLNSLNYIVGLISLGMLWLEFAAPEWIVKLGWSLKTILKSIPHVLDHGFALIHRAISIKDVKEMHKNSALSVLKTSIITLIVVVVFINILSDADPIFAEIVKTFREQIGERGMFTVFIILGLTYVMSFKFKKAAIAPKNLNWLSFQDLFWPNLSVTILFGIFAFIQWKYLFGGENNFHAFDLTYSEYVRKGFVETLIATVLGGLLSHLTAIVARDGENKKLQKLLQAINTILILEMTGMVISAWMRNDIYINTYGITRTRIAGEALMTWIGALLFGQAAFTWIQKVDERRVFIWMSAFTVGALGYLNAINMDMRIATAKPGVDGQDYFYTAHLSSDAYSAWQKTEDAAFDFYNANYAKKDWSEADRRELATFRASINIIGEQYTRLETMNDNIFFWNWSQSRALQSAKVEERSKRNACVIDGFNRIVASNGLSDVTQMEWDRMNNYEYPFTVRTFGENFEYYPQYEDDIYIKVLEANPDLAKEFDDKFGSYNRWDFANKLNENPEMKAMFAPLIVPQTCAL